MGEIAVHGTTEDDIHMRSEKTHWAYRELEDRLAGTGVSQ